MIIDIAIAIILIICIFMGDRKGFLRSFLSTFGWLISFLGILFLENPVTQYLTNKTNMKDDITVKVTEFVKERLTNAADESGTDLYDSLSDTVISALKNSVNGAAQTAVEKAAEPLADALFSLIVVIIIVLGIRICTWLLERLICFFLKESKPLSSADSILGMIFSFIKGLLISAVLVAVVLTVAIIGDFPGILDQIGSSLICTQLINAGIIPDTFVNFN